MTSGHWGRLLQSRKTQRDGQLPPSTGMLLMAGLDPLLEVLSGSSFWCFLQTEVGRPYVKGRREGFSHWEGSKDQVTPTLEGLSRSKASVTLNDCSSPAKEKRGQFTATVIGNIYAVHDPHA